MFATGFKVAKWQVSLGRRLFAPLLCSNVLPKGLLRLFGCRASDSSTKPNRFLSVSVVTWKHFQSTIKSFPIFEITIIFLSLFITCGENGCLPLSDSRYCEFWVLFARILFLLTRGLLSELRDWDEHELGLRAFWQLSLIVACDELSDWGEAAGVVDVEDVDFHDLEVFGLTTLGRSLRFRPILLACNDAGGRRCEYIAALTNCVFGIGDGETLSSEIAGDGRSRNRWDIASSSWDGSSTLACESDLSGL